MPTLRGLFHKGPQRSTKKHKEVQRDTKKHKETQRSTKRHRAYQATKYPQSTQIRDNPFYAVNPPKSAFHEVIR